MEALYQLLQLILVGASLVMTGGVMWFALTDTTVRGRISRLVLWLFAVVIAAWAAITVIDTSTGKSITYLALLACAGVGAFAGRSILLSRPVLGWTHSLATARDVSLAAFLVAIAGFAFIDPFGSAVVEILGEEMPLHGIVVSTTLLPLVISVLLRLRGESPVGKWDRSLGREVLIVTYYVIGALTLGGATLVLLIIEPLLHVSGARIL